MSNAKEDPERLALRASPKPVTRLNRRTLVIGGAVIAAGLLSVALWSLQPKRPTAAQSESQTPKQAQKVSPAEGLQALPRDYSSIPKVPAPKQSIPELGAPLGELGRPVVRAERAAGIPSLEPRNTFERDSNEDRVRVDRLRQVQEDAAAAKAQVFFQLSRKATATAQPQSEARSHADAAMDRVMQLLPNALPQTGASSTGQSDESSQNGQSAKQSFLQREPDQKIYATGTLQTPRSPFQVMAGTVIPAALVTAINSDLPGQMIATVTENVYDTVTGQYLLVPQGTRLIGQYDSQIAYGQSRVLLVWTRMILPDGSSIVLDRLPGVDVAGQAGLEDKVNWHWARIFEGAALSTMIGMGAELASPARQNSGNTVVVAGRESIQSTVSDVGQQITKKNLNIQPTLTVRAGIPLNVIVNKDLVLRPFQSSQMQARTP